MTSQDRKKIANIYLNNETHQTIKDLAAHHGSTIQATTANFLEEMQPAMQEMVKALDDIKFGSKRADNLVMELAERYTKDYVHELMANADLHHVRAQALAI